MTDPDQPHIDLSAVEAAEAKAQSAEADKAAADEEVHKKNRELYDRVVEGETTGDRFTDFVIVRNRGHRPEAVELFRTLEERVAAHAGEPVMVVSRAVDYHTHSFPGGLKDPYVVERIGVGILTGSELNIDHEAGQWSFPTDVHRTYGDQSEGVQEGPLTTAAPDTYDFQPSSPLEGAWDTPMTLKPGTSVGFAGGSSRENPVTLEIAVGHEEIEALLASRLRSEHDRRAYEGALDSLMRLTTS